MQLVHEAVFDRLADDGWPAEAPTASSPAAGPTPRSTSNPVSILEDGGYLFLRYRPRN